MPHHLAISGLCRNLLSVKKAQEKEERESRPGGSDPPNPYQGSPVCRTPGGGPSWGPLPPSSRPPPGTSACGRTVRSLRTRRVHDSFSIRWLCCEAHLIWFLITRDFYLQHFNLGKMHNYRFSVPRWERNQSRHQVYKFYQNASIYLEFLTTGVLRRGKNPFQYFLTIIMQKKIYSASRGGFPMSWKIFFALNLLVWCLVS